MPKKKAKKGHVCSIEPLGYRILVKLTVVEKKSEGGIILATETDRRKQQAGMEEGTIVALGSNAYLDRPGDPWIKVGDVVKFKRYEGVVFEEEDKDGIKIHYRILNDDDVFGRVLKSN